LRRHCPLTELLSIAGIDRDPGDSFIMDSKWITTHPYVGNLCSGFGGRTECEHRDWDTGERCGKSPYYHKDEAEAARLDRYFDQLSPAEIV